MSTKSIFLSHSHIDSTSAVFLEKALTDSFRPNLSVFCTSLPQCRCNSRNVERVGKRLGEKLHSADMIVVLASEASINSPWVKFETYVAGGDTTIFGGSLGPIDKFTIYDKHGEDPRFYNISAESLVSSDLETGRVGYMEETYKHNEIFGDKVEPPKIAGSAIKNEVNIVDYRDGSGPAKMMEPRTHDSGVQLMTTEYPDITEAKGLGILWTWVRLWLEIEPARDTNLQRIAAKLKILSKRQS